MSGWVNGSCGALGEPLSDHLEPPEDVVDEIFDELEEEEIEEEGEKDE
jgi:hypothetical protein